MCRLAVVLACLAVGCVARTNTVEYKGDSHPLPGPYFFSFAYDGTGEGLDVGTPVRFTVEGANQWWDGVVDACYHGEVWIEGGDEPILGKTIVRVVEPVKG